MAAGSCCGRRPAPPISGAAPRPGHREEAARAGARRSECLLGRAATLLVTQRRSTGRTRLISPPRLTRSLQQLIRQPRAWPSGRWSLWRGRPHSRTSGLAWPPGRRTRGCVLSVKWEQCRCHPCAQASFSPLPRGLCRWAGCGRAALWASEAGGGSWGHRASGRHLAPPPAPSLGCD